MTSLTPQASTARRTPPLRAYSRVPINGIAHIRREMRQAGIDIYNTDLSTPEHLLIALTPGEVRRTELYDLPDTKTPVALARTRHAAEVLQEIIHVLPGTIRTTSIYIPSERQERRSQTLALLEPKPSTNRAASTKRDRPEERSTSDQRSWKRPGWYRETSVPESSVSGTSLHYDKRLKWATPSPSPAPSVHTSRDNTRTSQPARREEAIVLSDSSETDTAPTKTAEAIIISDSSDSENERKERPQHSKNSTPFSAEEWEDSDEWSGSLRIERTAPSKNVTRHRSTRGLQEGRKPGRPRGSHSRLYRPTNGPALPAATTATTTGKVDTATEQTDTEAPERTKQEDQKPIPETSSQTETKKPPKRYAARTQAPLTNYVNPSCLSTSSRRLGPFPNLVPATTASALARPTTGLGAEPKARWSTNPHRPPITSAEARDDITTIMAELKRIAANRCQRYPPAKANILYGPTTRVFERHLRHIKLQFPIDFDQFDHATANACREMDIAPMRCPTLLERLDNGYLITPDGQLPLHLTANDKEGKPAVMTREEVRWRTSEVVHSWMQQVIPVICARRDEVERYRNVDLWEVIAEVASKRLGWVWTPATFRTIKDTTHKDCPWGPEIREALQTLSLHNSNAEGRQPLYNINIDHLLPEDTQAIASKKTADSIDRHRTILLDTFTPSKILLCAQPIYRRYLPYTPDEEGNTWNQVQEVVDKLLNWYKPKKHNLAQRQLRLHNLRKAPITKEQIETEISKSLFNIPFRIEQVQCENETTLITFHDVNLHLTAFCTVNVWARALSQQCGTTLTIPPDTAFPRKLRTLTYLDNTNSDEHTPASINAAITGQGHEVLEIATRNEQARDKTKIIIVVKNWQATLRLLQEAKVGNGTRVVLDYERPTIEWCDTCNSAGHTKCQTRQITECQLCPLLHAGINAHRTTTDGDDEENEEGKCCAGKRLLRIYLDTLLHLSIGQAAAGRGIFSMTVSGVMFRIHSLGATSAQAYGISETKPTQEQHGPAPPSRPNELQETSQDENH